jgi:ribosomal protein S17E
LHTAILRREEWFLSPVAVYQRRVKKYSAFLFASYRQKICGGYTQNLRAVLKIKFFHRYDVFVVRNNIISADNENLQPKNYF